MLKDAGLDRINHNLNSSRNYYSHICTTHTFDQRVENIHMLQRLGFEICSGGIIGMGESKEDVVDMLLELKRDQSGSSSDQLPASDSRYSSWRSGYLRAYL